MPYEVVLTAAPETQEVQETFAKPPAASYKYESRVLQGIWAAAGGGLNSVTSGNNGTCSASIKYICTAGTNTDGVYSGPAGWGTPNGVSVF